jgi:hypothetical protein
VGAEGWFVDPFGSHEHRWFSDGSPTRLVRDGGVEGYDRPPARPFPLPLVPAPERDAGAETLKRADDAERSSAPSGDLRRADDVAGVAGDGDLVDEIIDQAGPLD